MPYPTVAEIRAQVEASKIVAEANFKREWGTSDFRAVMMAMRETIPGSSSPIDASRKARALLAKES